MKRDELIERLAEVSHQIYLRQKEADLRAQLEGLDPTVTAHDRERAADTVAALEEFGVLDPSSYD